MEPALAWLDTPPPVPVTGVADAVPGWGGGPVPDAGTSVSAGQAVLFDGLVGSTPGGPLVPVDLLDGREGRALALLGQLPRSAALARGTAVWVHTGHVRPRRVEVVVAPTCRIQAAVTVHRQRLEPGDVERVGGVPTTTPARTAVDLLCFEDPETAVAGLRALLAAHLTVCEVSDGLATAVGRPVLRARRLLAAVTGG